MSQSPLSFVGASGIGIASASDKTVLPKLVVSLIAPLGRVLNPHRAADGITPQRPAGKSVSAIRTRACVAACLKKCKTIPTAQVLPLHGVALRACRVGQAYEQCRPNCENAKHAQHNSEQRESSELSQGCLPFLVDVESTYRTKDRGLTSLLYGSGIGIPSVFRSDRLVRPESLRLQKVPKGRAKRMTTSLEHHANLTQKPGPRPRHRCPIRAALYLVPRERRRTVPFTEAELAAMAFSERSQRKRATDGGQRSSDRWLKF